MKVFKEFWRTVVINGVEHPKYQVSNLGRVKNLDWYETGKSRICKLSKNKYGYLTVTVDHKAKKVHRLVAEAFIPNPEHKPFIDHISTIKTQNVVLLDGDGNVLYSTIRWCTHKENCNNPLTRKHLSENAPKPVLGRFGKENHNSIPIVQLSLDEKFIKKWDAIMEVERELGIDHSSIISCCKGKLKSAGGYRWMYYDDWVKLRKSKHSITDIKPLF